MRAFAVGVVLLFLAPAAVAGSEDDCGTGADAPDWGPGVVVAAPVDCAATFGAGDAWDSYRFEVPHGLDLVARVEPVDPALAAVVCLYAPRAENPFACRLGEAGVRSHDPRLWTARVYLCADASCERYGRGEYRLVLALSGTPSPRVHEEGVVQVGLPLGPHAAKAAPALADGLDGRWHDLARPTGTRDFLRFTWTGCDACLNLHWQWPDGTTLSASCRPSEPGLMDCRGAIGAVRVLVGASSGTDVAYAVDVWYAAP